MVTNNPPPYRIPIFQRIGQMEGVSFQVIFCCEREPYRKWDLPALDFNHIFLQENFVTLGGRYIHNNLDVIASLKRFSPDVIVTDGFNPTYLYAFSYAIAKGLPHISMTDGTYVSEEKFGALHRMARRFVYARSQAFISTCKEGLHLYESYGIAAEHCFESCLCVDNAAYSPQSQSEKKLYDFIFCGRIEPLKNPLFALAVAVGVAKKLQRKIHILFVGSGSEEELVRQEAELHSDLLDVTFAGFTPQKELPALYRSACIFLFPTLGDVWGVVVNEACAAGLPVIVSPHTGVTGELVRDGENGYICELDVPLWVKKAVLLLIQPDTYQRYSERSRTIVNQYTFDAAANGLVRACRHAFARVERQQKNKSVHKVRPRVVIVERQLLLYRVALYERLRKLLERKGIDFQLLIGEGTSEEKKKQNETALEWTISIPTRYFFAQKICWQPFGSYANGADLVVVMHENKLIYNLWLLSFGRPRRLAFWGHGRNMQSNRPNGLKERFKRWTIKKADWWFSYTKSSAVLIQNAGFPSACTTVVENAVDTSEMEKLCAEISVKELQFLREKLGLGDGPIGLYLGSLYREKRLDFLLDAVQRIREKIPGFQLLVVGAGTEQTMIEDAALKYSWLHYMGPLQHREKAQALRLADVMLNPGAVGLGIQDSFVSGAPMFTTDCGLHGPEISYLKSGQNGVMTGDDLDIYVDAVVTTLSDPAKIKKLRAGTRYSASRYTIENMAERLCNGILACLSH
jgi:glycosyltransferase involved in cell wall biosynthesis